MKNEEMFKKYMTGLAEVFDKKVTGVLSDIYWTALKQFSDEQCKEAFNRAMVQCKFFPKPVELIELIKDGNIEDMALVQANTVLKAIKYYGGQQSVKFSDKTTNAVVDQCFGSWKKICEELKESNEQWFRKDFIKFYLSYHRQGIESDSIHAGWVEIENASHGFIEHIPKPILVDDLFNDLKLIEGE